MTIYDYIEEFKSTISNAGIESPSEIITDGELHRFSSNGKPGDTAGYYTFFTNDDGSFGGSFGCWRDGVKGRWSSSGSKDKAKSLKVAELHTPPSFVREQLNAERACYAQRLYEKSETIPLDHPYITRKNINLWGDARYISKILCADFFNDKSKSGALTNCIVIPVLSETGAIQSIQVITHEDKKFFLKGGKLDGGRFTLNGDKSLVYVSEGFATGSTIHEVTGATVVVAFNAGALEKLVPSLITQYPSSEIIIAADNDHRKAKEGKGNRGLEVAKSIAEEHGIAYTFPEFSAEDIGTDWNDFSSCHGIEQTKIALTANQLHVQPKQIFECFDSAIKALLEDRDNELAFDAAVDFIKDASTLQSGRMKKKLKKIADVNIGEIDKVISVKEGEAAPELSHGEIATHYIEQFKAPRPVCEYGRLWSYDDKSGIWRDTPLSKVGVAISKKYVGEKLCRRESDYKAIASHAYNVLEQSGFFESAPKGLHIPAGFIFVDGKHMKQEKPRHEHRARFRLDITPDISREPELLLSILQDAFAGNNPEEQIRQLRMLTGLALFGLQAKEQRAVLLYGEAGSGKSLFLKLLEALVPKEYRTSVSPLHMDNDYKIAALAGKLLNLVPEIDKEKSVPSAEFKSITGGDTVSAREPYGKVFTFTPDAGCWFNGNYYLTTKDHSEGFWRRWAIIHFSNSKPEKERDPELLSKIIAQELPSILAWAIRGVEDYFSNGLFLSCVHQSCIQEWKRNGNSVCSWLHDIEDNGISARKHGMSNPRLKLSHAYTIYKEWCRHNNRKPFNKQAFKAHMAKNGHNESLYNGYHCYETLYDARQILAFS